MTDVRTGQFKGKISREEFRRRFLERFTDPAFDGERENIDRLEAIAWDGYQNGRKAPHTRPAGPGYANPSYKLSLDWLAAKAAIERAAERHADRGKPTRILTIVGSGRNDGTCPGEMSKSYRLAQLAAEAIAEVGATCDMLDLSLLGSEPFHHIHPCKACVSTAMPLCHWPCSCYPNHASGQTNDAMNGIYPRWVEAHGVLIITPVYWYQSTSSLKLMIDRLVCADGGNPDPTSTDGKDAKRAKEMELAGWPFPKHLSGRSFGVLVHGDVGGSEGVRRALSDWLSWMGLVEAGNASQLAREIGYYQPYATSHQALDEDRPMREEAKNAARAVVRGAAALRTGELKPPDEGLVPPRRK